MDLVLTSRGKRYLASLVQEDERLTESWDGTGELHLVGEAERDLMVLQAVEMEEDYELSRDIFRPVIRRLFEAGYIEGVGR